MASKDKGSKNGNRRKMLLRLIRRGFAVFLLLMVLGIIYLYWQLSEHAPTVELPPEQPPVTVSTVVVEGETVSLSPRYVGQVEASQIVEIRARVDGFLQERAFEEGTVVEPGDLLYRIDPRSLEAELAIATSRRSGAEARMRLARQQFERFEQLSQRGAATAEELEESQTATLVAEAEVQLAEAQIAQAQLNLSYTQIESPIHGVIGESQQDVGAYVSPGSGSLLAVVSQMDPIYVRMSISEEESLRFQALVESGEIETPDLNDYDVQVTLSTGQMYPHHGKINFVDVRVDPTTGTRVIRAIVPNPTRLLVPGQAVHAAVVGARRRNTLLVPQQAVMQTPTGSFVYVVRDDSTVEQRPVVVGEWYEDRWIVEEGLHPGERVVTDQLMMLRPGATVQVR